MDEMSDLKKTLEAIDASIARSKEAIKLGEALDRLMKNQDFKDVILDGYLDSEAKKLFSILTDPTGATPYTDDKIHLKLATISDLRGYIGTDGYNGTVKMAADRAPQEILREEQYRKEVTAEYAEEEE